MKLSNHNRAHSRPLALTTMPLVGLCALAAMLLPGRPHAQGTATSAQLFADGKFDRAHQVLTTTVKQDPKNTAARIDQIRSSMRQDNWQLALTEAQGGLSAQPQNADLHGLYACVLVRAGRPQQAEKEADKALTLNPNCYWALVARGRVQLFNEQPDAAHTTLTKAVELRPEYPEALYYLLESFDAKTPRPEIEKAVKAYVKLKPKGHPHDMVFESMARSDSAKDPFDEKKNRTVMEAVGKVDQKLLQAADEGKEKPVTITIPFERYEEDKETIFLPLTINGVRLRLLFDTGAGRGIHICGEAVERLHLPTIYKSYAYGVSGKEEIKICRAEEMKIGGQAFRNVKLATSPNGIGMPVDGLIGGAVFEQYAVTIDYENNNLILSRGKTAAAPKPEEGDYITTVPFHNIGGDIVVPMKLEDRTEAEWGILDTGAGGMGVLSFIEAKGIANKRHNDETVTVHINKRMGIGTSATGFDAVAFEFPVDLGLVHNSGTPYFMELQPILGATLMDAQVNRVSDFHYSALIGISYVAQAKRVTFDYPHHLMTLEFGPKKSE